MPRRAEFCSSLTASRSWSGPPKRRTISHDVAVGGDRRHLQHVGQDELGVAVLGVLFEEFVQDRRGPRGRSGRRSPCCLAAQALGALAAGAQRGVEGEVAEQVEGVGLGLAGGLGQFVEVDAAFGQRLDDLGALLGVGPLRAQLGRGRDRGAHLLGGVVGVAHDPQLLAVGVEFVDEVGGDLDLAAVEVELARVPRAAARSSAGLGLRLGSPPARSGSSMHLGRRPFRAVDLLFGDQGRVAVEVRVGEQAGGRAGVVEDVEPELAVVVADAGAAADDLLELGHGADHAGQHDVLAGGGIHAGGEQLRGGEDDRRAGLHVLEAARVAAADVAFVGGDPADVVADAAATRSAFRLFRAAAHLVGVLLVHAEDDGLGEAVGLLEELGQVPGDGLGAGPQGDDALEVLGLVFLVGDVAAVAVQLVLARPPAGGVPLGDDPVHAVGGEEAVLDALAQAVLVDRVAEVEVGVAVVFAQGVAVMPS